MSYKCPKCKKCKYHEERTKTFGNYFLIIQVILAVILASIREPEVLLGYLLFWVVSVLFVIIFDKNYPKEEKKK